MITLDSPPYYTQDRETLFQINYRKVFIRRDRVKKPTPEAPPAPFSERTKGTATEHFPVSSSADMQQRGCFASLSAQRFT